MTPKTIVIPCATPIFYFKFIILNAITANKTVKNSPIASIAINH